MAFDPSRLTTPEQWVAAGKVVFNAPTSMHPVFFTAQNLRDPHFSKRTGTPVAKDGTIPFEAAGLAILPGVTARANTGMLLPPQTPDLIGVSERRFLDHTGLIRQRDMGDPMRYASLAQDLFSADRDGAANAGNPPAPAEERDIDDAEMLRLRDLAKGMDKALD